MNKDKQLYIYVEDENAEMVLLVTIFPIIMWKLTYPLGNVTHTKGVNAIFLSYKTKNGKGQRENRSFVPTELQACVCVCVYTCQYICDCPALCVSLYLWVYPPASAATPRRCVYAAVSLSGCFISHWQGVNHCAWDSCPPFLLTVIAAVSRFYHHSSLLVDRYESAS